MQTQWNITSSTGAFTVTCYCGIYYDMEYHNLKKLQNNIMSMCPDIRISLTRRYPCLEGRGKNAPSKEIIQQIIDKNHKSFKHPATINRDIGRLIIAVLQNTHHTYETGPKVYNRWYLQYEIL